MKTDDVRNVAVVGAGLMGHGIAQEFALTGYSVMLNDVSDEILEAGLQDINRNLEMLVELGLVSEEQAKSVPGNIRADKDLQKAVANADVVIEAVPEDLNIKKATFAELDALCPDHTILASNSSSLMPSQLASATNRPDRVLVTHYFNPPYLLPLVEIVRSGNTSDETLSTIYELLLRIGKRPAIVQKEVPGFVGNRLQIALIRECLSIVEKGIASPEDVDIVVKNGFGRRLAAAGPIEVFDMAGWDVIYGMGHLLNEIDSSSEFPSCLKEKVEKGDLGVKTGKGFYDWTSESADRARRRIARALVTIHGLADLGNG